MDIYNKPAKSEPYVTFISTHPQHCLTNILFSLARTIHSIVENKNLKVTCFKNTEKNTRTKLTYVVNRI